jgi:hypothetical protein
VGYLVECRREQTWWPKDEVRVVVVVVAVVVVMRMASVYRPRGRERGLLRECCEGVRALVQQGGGVGKIIRVGYGVGSRRLGLWWGGPSRMAPVEGGG